MVAPQGPDHTAEASLRASSPREEYFYRFVTENSASPIGHFRTAPPMDSNEKIKIVFYSCQHFQTGFFNVQRAIAKEKDVDLVVCLGDYVYEYSNQYEDMKLRHATGRNHDGDAQFLDEWREKYRALQGRPDLQAMHAAHPPRDLTEAVTAFAESEVAAAAFGAGVRDHFAALGRAELEAHRAAVTNRDLQRGFEHL